MTYYIYTLHEKHKKTAILKIFWIPCNVLLMKAMIECSVTPGPHQTTPDSKPNTGACIGKMSNYYQVNYSCIIGAGQKVVLLDCDLTTHQKSMIVNKYK